ncbi:LacI family DNA-binding transcriptional regulator [Mucisphaera calidilacus]|uniref:HTH-type transcriptional repressor PurR n=1 Tax=Mucisphaera calidilacus TaxID=2527982 RepID=A0A518BUF7_9BACT|nr:GntR family transcriptional regulator [Mucisphaera calidilacus]QDU70625.1 HTH-type transcriptional repressor PurR [Mucisphaera calidilacus]
MSLLELNNNSDTPLVQQIQTNLRSRILRDEFPPGYKLPSIRQLSHDLGCSTGIVERAVSTLTAEGLLKSEPRRGVYVRKPREKRVKSKDIALILPGLRLEHMASMSGGVHAALAGSDYRLIIQSADNDFDDEIHLLEYLAHDNLVGVVICPPTADSYAEPIKEFVSRREIPLVLATHRLVGLSSVDAVAIDEFEHGRAAVDYLLSKGHREIALIGGHGLSLSSRQTLEGIAAGLRRYRLAMSDLHKIDVDVLDLNDEEPWLNGQVSTERFLREHNPGITAILSLGNYSTIGAYRAVQSLGLSIPDDISILSTGSDLQAFALLQPSITVFTDQLHATCERATFRLLQRIENPGMQPEAIQIPPQLIERESVRKIPVSK